MGEGVACRYTNHAHARYVNMLWRGSGGNSLGILPRLGRPRFYVTYLFLVRVRRFGGYKSGIALGGAKHRHINVHTKSSWPILSWSK